MNAVEPLFVTLNNYPESCNLCRTGTLTGYVDGQKWLTIEHFAICYIRNGTAKLFCSEGVMDLKRGDIYIHLPGVRHRLEFLDPDTQITTVEFTKEFLDYNPLGETIKDRFITFLLMDMAIRSRDIHLIKVSLLADDQAYLIKQFDRFEYEFKMRREGMFEILHDVLLVIMDILGWKYLYQPTITNVEKKYRKLNNLMIASVEYIHEHYNERIVLDDIAKRFGTSKTVYCTLFKQTYGVTFHTYLNDLRRDKAVHMLLETDLSAEEIASLAGYCDFTALYRSFMKHYGVSPGQYRKNKERT